jgi:hypothetical protein
MRADNRLAGSEDSTLESDSSREPGWASLGLTAFAAVLLIFSGLLVAGYGFTALFFGGFASGTESAAGISAEAWSVIFAVGGVVLFMAGCNIFAGRFWARVIGIAVSVIALVVGLISLDAYPVFAVITIVLNLGIIWSLGFRWNDIRAAM